MKKQVCIIKDVYDQLKEIRDEEDLASFTETIKKLINYYKRFPELRAGPTVSALDNPEYLHQVTQKW